MASDQEPPARPRRERPLVAAGREKKDPVSTPPPTVRTPPTGSRVFEPPIEMTVGERPDHVDVAFPGPVEQRRWTVAIRMILLVPHFAWLYILNLGLGFALLIAWFAALFTKRVPDEIATFIGRVTRYQTRVLGYGLLLTDEYPPFGLTADHGIDLNVNPGEFNRAAVFFRMILIIPSGIVSSLALFGAFTVGVVSWLLALILGRLPQPLWEANAAVLRYATRAQAFYNLLTAEQPAGLFGDKESGPLTPPTGDALDLPARPRLVRLVLSAAAKRLVALFLVLASLLYIGSFVTLVVTGAKLGFAFNELSDSHTALIDDVDAWDAELERCVAASDTACFDAANVRLADSFGSFANEVADIEFPANAAPTELIEDARRCESALRAMASAETEESYNAAFAEYQRAVEEFDDEYSNYAGELEYE